MEPFTGSELFEDWLPTLERAGHWNSWSSDEMLMQLAGHLRGRALQEWNLIRPDEQKNWTKAVKALSGRQEPKNQAYAVQDFRHAVQSGSELVSDYIRRTERTFHLAYG